MPVRVGICLVVARMVVLLVESLSPYFVVLQLGSSVVCHCYCDIFGNKFAINPKKVHLLK